MNNDFFENLEQKNDKELPEETYSESLNGTEKNINYFLKLSKVIKIISFSLAIILFIVAMSFSSIEGGIITFVSCLCASVIFVVIAILCTPFLNWKAYTLKNLYEINKSINKKK